MMLVILRRLGSGLAVLWLVHLLTFAAVHLMPGDPWADLAGDRTASPAAVERIKHLYGLDQPLVVQYLRDLDDKVHGRFGYSLKIARGQPVIDLLASAAPISLSIGCGALLVALILGLSGGMVAAASVKPSRTRGRTADQCMRLMTTLGIGTPDFILGPLLLLGFSLWLGWFPAGGFEHPSGLVLPILTLAVPLAAQIARLARASMLEELGADFIRTAYAKGADDSRVMYEHALRPACGPVLAYLSTAAAQVLTGSMVVEGLFAIPGLGYFFVSGALQQDWPVITGAALVYAALLVAFNLLADLGLTWLDPRTR